MQRQELDLPLYIKRVKKIINSSTPLLWVTQEEKKWIQINLFGSEEKKENTGQQEQLTQKIFDTQYRERVMLAVLDNSDRRYANLLDAIMTLTCEKLYEKPEEKQEEAKEEKQEGVEEKKQDEKKAEKQKKKQKKKPNKKNTTLSDKITALANINTKTDRHIAIKMGVLFLEVISEISQDAKFSPLNKKMAERHLLHLLDVVANRSRGSRPKNHASILKIALEYYTDVPDAEKESISTTIEGPLTDYQRLIQDLFKFYLTPKVTHAIKSLAKDGEVQDKKSLDEKAQDDHKETLKEINQLGESILQLSELKDENLVITSIARMQQFLLLQNQSICQVGDQMAALILFPIKQKISEVLYGISNIDSKKECDFLDSFKVELAKALDSGDNYRAREIIQALSAVHKALVAQLDSHVSVAKLTEIQNEAIEKCENASSVEDRTNTTMKRRLRRLFTVIAVALAVCIGLTLVVYFPPVAMMTLGMAFGSVALPAAVPASALAERATNWWIKTKRLYAPPHVQSLMGFFGKIKKHHHEISTPMPSSANVVDKQLDRLSENIKIIYSISKPGYPTLVV